jgi:hypothetical protein
LREYVSERDNSTLLACVGDISRTSLEYFCQYVYGENYTTHSGVFLRERKLDMRSKENFESVLQLWKSEKLLSKSKDFPHDLQKLGGATEKFSDAVVGHVKRMKVLPIFRTLIFLIMRTLMRFILFPSAWEMILQELMRR